VSLPTIVQENLAGHLHRGRVVFSPIAVRAIALPTRISISSMRVLEVGLAVAALATALLMGTGR
jgi:hypothetical protein